MKTLYTSILAELKKLQIGSPTATDAAFLRHIDLDTGQLDSFEHVPPVGFPCALIDTQISSASDITTINSKKQQVNAMITIRLAWNFTGNTSSHISAAHLDQSLAYYDQSEAVYQLLQAFTGDKAFTGLSRRSARTERRGDRYKVINITFVTDYFER